MWGDGKKRFPFFIRCRLGTEGEVPPQSPMLRRTAGRRKRGGEDCEWAVPPRKKKLSTDEEETREKRNRPTDFYSGSADSFGPLALTRLAISLDTVSGANKKEKEEWYR